ncbi:hypothetical protein [Halochromatium sp.]
MNDCCATTCWWRLRFGGAAELRHRIKRADRLLGNRHLQRDATRIDAALARMLLAKVAEPLIVIDCSDLKADQSLHLLRASLAAILLWLINTAAEPRSVHEHLRPGSRKRRAYSRLFLARLLLTLEHCRTTIAELVDAIGPLDQWVASDHDALLAE